MCYNAIPIILCCAQTRIVRSWDCGRPLLFAPSMNTLMWQHPITSQQIDVLLSFGFQQIECIEKTLACGDTGVQILQLLYTNIRDCYLTIGES